MYVGRVLFLYRGFACCFSLESSHIDWICALCDGFAVHRSPLGRCLVRIASMKCCPVRGSGSGLHRKEGHYLSPRHVSAHCTLSYPSLPYPDLPCPAVLLYLCVCVFLLSDLSLSLSLCLSVIVGGIHGPPLGSLDGPYRDLFAPPPAGSGHHREDRCK